MAHVECGATRTPVLQAGRYFYDKYINIYICMDGWAKVWQNAAQSDAATAKREHLYFLRGWGASAAALFATSVVLLA